MVTFAAKNTPLVPGKLAELAACPHAGEVSQRSARLVPPGIHGAWVGVGGASCSVADTETVSVSPMTVDELPQL